MRSHEQTNNDLENLRYHKVKKLKEIIENLNEKSAEDTHTNSNREASNIEVDEVESPCNEL